MKTKEELVQEAQQLQQQINNLVGQQNKVLGKIELLEEQEKEYPSGAGAKIIK